MWNAVGRPPARARQALLAARQPLADLGGDRDRGEEADHRRGFGALTPNALAPSALATTGARRPAMTLTPAAFGWMPSPLAQARPDAGQQVGVERYVLGLRDGREDGVEVARIVEPRPLAGR